MAKCWSRVWSRVDNLGPKLRSGKMNGKRLRFENFGSCRDFWNRKSCVEMWGRTWKIMKWTKRLGPGSKLKCEAWDLLKTWMSESVTACHQWHCLYKILDNMTFRQHVMKSCFEMVQSHGPESGPGSWSRVKIEVWALGFIAKVRDEKGGPGSRVVQGLENSFFIFPIFFRKAALKKLNQNRNFQKMVFV